MEMLNYVEKLKCCCVKVIFFTQQSYIQENTQMTRFHQTVAPLGLMLSILFKLSIGFGVVTFFEMLVQAPDLEANGYKGWANMTDAYRNWTDHAVCESGVMSQFINEYPDVSGVMLTALALFMLGSIRAGIHIIIPYYLTTLVIGAWSS